jgi:outer membrane protein TolC
MRTTRTTPSRRWPVRDRRVALVIVLAGLAPMAHASSARAQPAPPTAPATAPATPIPRGASGAAPVSFEEVVKRAMARSPDAALATEEIRRAEALVRQVRAGWLPTLNANATYTRLDADRELSGRVILGANQLSGNLQLSVPILAPRGWAASARAREAEGIARSTSTDTKRQVALLAGRTYLSVIAQRRVLETAGRALDVARAHEEFALSRLRGGVGNRLDAARATQERATAQARFQAQVTALARAQEALGLAVGEDGPLDAEDVALAPPPPMADALREASGRSDVVVEHARVETARKAHRDDYLDYLPVLSALAQPFYQNPPSLTQPQTGWQAQLVLTLPLFDGGNRYGLADERAALHAQAKVRLDASLRRARSEVRIASEALQRADASLTAAREAALVAAEALTLAELAYRAGATSNIELVDAQRRERDADADAAIAEDAARQARLDLLSACGRFPGL